jgi:hypothetical protein
MKKISFTGFFLAFLLVGVVVSCKKKDEFTLEDQPVTGDFSYVTQSIVPLVIDTASQQMISATITMTGSGIVTDMGQINIQTTFDFNFVTGTGTNFVTTYTGDNPADSYSATGSSQRQQDGSILMTETFSNGKGRFSRMEGGGVTSVNITPDGSGGTGTANWTVTY